MPSKNVKIDVNVNVDELYNGGSVDGCCTLSDDNGGSTPSGNPEQFTSKVYAKKRVIWEPEKDGDRSNRYDLDLTSIEYESGNNIFGEESLPAKEGKVVARVESSASVGDEEKYTIKFTITERGGTTKSFEIDPEIKVETDDD